jgi:hypothetical protein
MSFPHFVERFRRDGVEAEYFPIALSERVFDRVGERRVDPRSFSDRPLKLTFVGSVDPRVTAVASDCSSGWAPELDIEIWGYGTHALAAGSPIRKR